MAKSNLAARLARIRTETPRAERSDAVVRPSSLVSFAPSAMDFSAGWAAPSPLVRSRVVPSSRPIPGAPFLSPALGLLCPLSADAFPEGSPLDSRRLLFFDLETTGLSGGAGTVAFLAAFGRIRSDSGTPFLEITQHLLLDYPGEGEFIDLVLSVFAADPLPPVLVSYNGKSFDTQLLRSRCLMNGRKPPALPHLDLVHGSRRLWKRMLPSCSLAEVERGILGIDRGQDLGGAEAPDAWFDFLKHGETGRLIAICEHNLRDLEGLATLLFRMESIAGDPLRAAAAGEADAEGLALRWIAAQRAGRAEADGTAARSLLELAAEGGSPRCAWALALTLAREGNAERAAELVRTVAEAKEGTAAAGLRVAACRRLARDAARRSRDYEAACGWIARALAIAGEGSPLADGLRRAALLYGRNGKTRE